MANLKEIRAKVVSIKSTQKITRAMQMVAVSKMRRAQEGMAKGRPYIENMQRVIADLVKVNKDKDNIYLRAFAENQNKDELIPKEVKSIGYIVVSSDRGLAGGLNINLFKTLLNHLKEAKEKSIQTQFALIGQKAVSFCNASGGKVLAVKTGLSDAPSMEDLYEPITSMFEAFSKREIDVIYLISNQFVNAMTQKPQIQQLLPMPKGVKEEGDSKAEYLYEPEPQDLLAGVIGRYLNAVVYQNVLENIACEQAARMVAMQTATDNAGELIKSLQLVYNKLRQAAITQEISEIVGGAAAV